MTGTILALGVACAAIGLGLATLTIARAWRVFAVFLASIILTSILPVFSLADSEAVLALSALAILAAGLALFGSRASLASWFAVAAMAGAAIGAAVSASGFEAIAATLPITLVFVPARILIARFGRVPIQFLSSWVIAIGTISGAFAVAPPAAQMGDHAQ
jgi:hypothetical protein